MRLIDSFRRRRLMSLALVTALAAAGGVAVWQASASSEGNRQLKERVRRGVGSEVRFASPASGPGQVDAAVESAAEFIFYRSGLRMSDETKRRLAKAESEVLKGKAKHITLGELTDGLTGAVVERLGTLTDEEIEMAADASSDAGGEVRSRADGRWGVLTRQSLVQQAKSGREWSRQGDAALGAALRPMIEGEVKDRADSLGTALPEQFGQAQTRGVTPTQALIIAYSVATDDPLADSRGDISEAVVQKRIEARMTREQKKAQKNVSGRPYGSRGYVHPSAAPLFFRAGVEKILNISEGGNK